MKERKNVYKLPKGDTTLEWYSKAVIEMKKRPSTDPTSWNYQAAIHGFAINSPFWKNAAPLPPGDEQLKYWRQCQHGSWYFLPWHRMYLAYFEEIVAQTIVSIGGPKDWALPYWDYSDTSNPDALNIPPAFVSPAKEANGLWMTDRESNVLDKKYVVLDALNTIPYTGDGRTSPLGFGGPETSFSHGGGTHGQLERIPHDMVHVLIGGAMGDPRTAGLDPIFWLHHANIDRLWQVWLNKEGGRANPTESEWLDFKFYFHNKDKKHVELKCRDVIDTRQVLSGYTYQDVKPGVPLTEDVSFLRSSFFSQPLEIVAATDSTLKLSSRPTVIELELDSSLSDKISGLRTLTEGFDEATSSYLHFENVKGEGVPPIQDVYLSLPDHDGKKKSYYAGALSFFGIEEASTSNAHHSGSGQRYTLNVSKIINKLRDSSDWNATKLKVSLEPIRKMDKDASVSIGRISLYIA